jgi:Group II intron, maturase-specific domain/Phosphoenolpyruvate phosphomutase
MTANADRFRQLHTAPDLLILTNVWDAVGARVVVDLGAKAVATSARPSKKAVASIRDNIRRRLRPGNQAPWEEVARDLNRTVRGWAAYFSYGSVSKARRAVHAHLDHAVRRFLCRRHKVAGSGFRQFPSKRFFGELGVFCLDTAPRRGSAHASM